MPFSRETESPEKNGSKEFHETLFSWCLISCPVMNGIQALLLLQKKITGPRRTPLETVFVDGDKVRAKENPERVVEYDASKKYFIDRETGKTFTALRALELTPSKSSWTKCEVLMKNEWIRVSDYRDMKFNTPISECDDDDDEESAETPPVTT